jgi:hypothetical protein
MKSQRSDTSSVLEKFAAVQMLDVHLPTTDGCEVVLTCYTQPEKDLRSLTFTRRSARRVSWRA